MPLALGGLLAAGIAFASSGGEDDVTATEVSAYQKELFPLAEEWGRIEIQGMRAAIGDLSDGDAEGVPAVTIAGEARAWQASLIDLRKRIAALTPPEPLVPAERLFDRAIVRYIDAAIEFEKAADGPETQRQVGIERGIEAALDGARLYNEASMVLQRVRKSVGLPETPDFPNRPAGDQVVQ